MSANKFLYGKKVSYWQEQLKDLPEKNYLDLLLVNNGKFSYIHVAAKLDDQIFLQKAKNLNSNMFDELLNTKDSWGATPYDLNRSLTTKKLLDISGEIDEMLGCSNGSQQKSSMEHEEKNIPDNLLLKPTHKKYLSLPANKTLSLRDLKY